MLLMEAGYRGTTGERGRVRLLGSVEEAMEAGDGEGMAQSSSTREGNEIELEIFGQK